MKDWLFQSQLTVKQEFMNSVVNQKNEEEYIKSLLLIFMMLPEYQLC